MKDNTVYVRKYRGSEDALSINEREILRYSGFRGQPTEEDGSLMTMLDEVIKDLAGSFSYQVCYRRMDITWDNGMPLLPFESSWKDLAPALFGSGEVILFAATIGINIDRYIARFHRSGSSPGLSPLAWRRVPIPPSRYTTWSLM